VATIKSYLMRKKNASSAAVLTHASLKIEENKVKEFFVL